MHNFVIITDTASDMTRDLRERFGVEDYVHGVLVFPDGHSELSDLDWGNITPEEYYGSMKDKKALYSTSLPSPQEMCIRDRPLPHQLANQTRGHLSAINLLH